MFEVLKLNAISDKVNDIFDKNYVLKDESQNPDAILVRSFQMAEYPVGSNLLAVARAGAGVNNIPLKKMADAGVCVFNTPGANANAVKELVILSLLLASRNVDKGINWANGLASEGDNVAKAVEKGKKQFVGCEILGKTLGVVGLGAIGVKVANAANALGMKVVGYDPMISENARKTLAPEVKIAALDELFAASDYITLHVPFIEATKGMINAANFAKMKDGVTILNFSRGELADVSAVKTALSTGKLAKYVVDFPTAEVINTDGIIAVPHLGASTEEAEDNCAVMAAEELRDYLENGNVKNSVNFPLVSIPREGDRLAVIGTAEAADRITAAAAGFAFTQKVRDNVSYTLIDGNGAHALEAKYSALNGVLKVRAL